MTAPLPTVSRWNMYSRSRYPRLWDGCVGAWCPSLGHTGARLHDYGQRMAWATPSAYGATNWAVERGAYAYDFQGGQYATTSVDGPTGDKSISLWYRNYFTYTGGSQYSTILGWGPVSTAAYYFMLHGTDPALGGAAGVGIDVNGNSAWAAVNDTLWHHVATTNTGNTHLIYVDGVLFNTATRTTATVAGSILIGAITGGIVASRGIYQDDMRVYSRVLQPEEIRLLARRRAIAFEPAYRPAYYTETDAGGGASRPYAWQSARLIGAGR